ncbi:MAG: hypothetical protein ACRDV7_13155, partial [Acidimicrobiia bacterium]
FETRLVALDTGFAWVRFGEAFFVAAGAEPVSLGPATYVMAGSTPGQGWTVRRADDGWDLTRFDGSTGALGATYHSSAAPQGAVRRGLVVASPASFTRGSEIEIWDPATDRSFAIAIDGRSPMVGAAGGTRVVWFDQTCSSECRTQVTDTDTGETRTLPENAYPFSWSATTPTGNLLYVQLQDPLGESRLAAVDLATMELVDVPDSNNAEVWVSSAGGVAVFARQGDVFVWMPGWPAPRFLTGGGFGPVAGPGGFPAAIAVR